MNVPRHWREIPERYRMEAYKCSKCGYIAFPERLVCPECSKRKFDKVNLSGKGRLTTFTIVRVPPAGYTDQAPYAVGIIELEEGVKIMAQISDCDPEKLKSGDPLIAKFRRVAEEGKSGMIMYGYKFVPDVGV